MNTTIFRMFAVVSAVVVFSGCGTSNPAETDEGGYDIADIHINYDSGPDSGLDANGSDAGQDSATNPDGIQSDSATPDVIDQDVDQEAVEDTAVLDNGTGEDQGGTDNGTGEDTNVDPDNGVGQDANVGQDAVIDIGNSTECGFADSIKGLLNCAEGDIDVMLSGVTVTKVTSKGWYIADSSTNHGMYIYEGSNPDWGYTVAINDIVDLHVTKLGNYQGTQQVTGKDGVTKKGTGNAAAFIVNLMNGSKVPAESIESRVVSATDATVTSASGKNGTISYGSATNVTVFADYANIPCVGLTLDIVSGIVVEYNGLFEIKLFAESDIANPDTSTCETPPEYDMTNWNFEKTGQDDPPEGFYKATTGFTATRTATGGREGSAGCTLTWTSTANQDFDQGYMFPVVPGDTVMFAVDMLDNDAGGKARLGLMFYDVSENFLSNSYSDVYSADSASWVPMDYSIEVPAGAAFARGRVRLYDEAASWDGNATVTIDNWDMIDVAP